MSQGSLGRSQNVFIVEFQSPGRPTHTAQTACQEMSKNATFWVQRLIIIEKTWNSKFWEITILDKSLLSNIFENKKNSFVHFEVIEEKILPHQNFKKIFSIFFIIPFWRNINFEIWKFKVMQACPLDMPGKKFWTLTLYSKEFLIFF